ncbi:Surfactin synthase subunit 2 [Sporomusa ovata DSM 2662]|uniref:Probable non-ribosomal peptide synthetase n=1 Tax=Sporomusa ovata TaxID=2378 RepID=A0A0U1KY46_9FIRM|nr:condensation domain-containing protein [Sporomusa ovata]EQB28923.1 amino acid adenylation domain-containing protein [Sporomusa ovata DSM 2662]CQR72351.1 Probable non-ribosomal peptide synthetase [Sporomusa ovata]
MMNPYLFLIYQNIMRSRMMGQPNLYGIPYAMPNFPYVNPPAFQPPPRSAPPLKYQPMAAEKQPPKPPKPTNPLLTEVSKFTAKNLDAAALDKITELYGLNVQDIYELSPGQQWMFDEAQVVTSTFFTQALLKIVGKVNVAAFRQNLDKVVNKHDGLRTAFVHTGLTKPYQVVLKSRQAELLLRDFSQQDESEIDDLLEQQMLADRRRGFDLERDVLIRIAIYKLDEASSAILISLPHITFDGVSAMILFKELFIDYAFNESGKAIEEIAAGRYTNYMDWLATVDKEQEKKYWVELLTDLPAFRPIPGYQPCALEFVKASSAVVLDEAISQKLQTVQARSKATLNNVIQTAWGVMLQRIYQMEDVTIGAISSGREGAVENVNHILGGMVNAIPVRIKADPSLLFKDLVSQVRKQFFESMENAHCSPNEIKKWLGREMPLFDHLLNFQNFAGAADMRKMPDLPGISLVGTESFDYLASDLCVYLVTTKNKLQANFVYNANTFSTGTIKLLQNNFVRVIEQICDNPDMPISHIQTDSMEAFRKIEKNEEFERLQVVGKLKEMKLFAGLTDEVIKRILQMAKVRSYTADDRIVKLDGKPQQFMVILNGFAELSVKSLEGWLTPVRILKAGDTVGLDAIIDEAKSFWEVTAFSDNVEVLVLERFTILELLSKYAELRINLLSLVHDQLKISTRLWVNAE